MQSDGDALLHNTLQRRTLLAGRKRAVCRATFDGYREADSAAYKFLPERCARTRTPGSAAAPTRSVRRSVANDATLLRAHLLRHNRQADAADPNPIGHGLWVRLLDPDMPKDGAVAQKGYVLAMMSSCVMGCFQGMIDPAVRLLHPDPVRRADHLLSAWKGAVLETVRPHALQRRMRTSMCLQLMAVTLTHCDALLGTRAPT